jgi:hypothetical protein
MLPPSIGTNLQQSRRTLPSADCPPQAVVLVVIIIIVIGGGSLSRRCPLFFSGSLLQFIFSPS